ncbi:MAG: ATP-binding cassette domain-containing protein, partial [Microbacteriaceae bacterium]
ARGAGAVAGTAALAAGLGTLLVLLTVDPAPLGGPLFALVALVPVAVVDVVAAVPAAVGVLRQVRLGARRIATAVPAVVPAEIPRAPRVPRAVESTAIGTAVGGTARPDTAPAIRLRGVAARWPGTDHDAISSVTLDLDPGEVLLVTGPSGSGKTTLAHVLVRFLEHRGSYTIGGVEARELDPDTVRRIVGLVEQRPFVFDESVRQNLLFARDTADEAALWDALERVGLAGWAREHGGLDAPVGERGALVSGGQAQRLALARGLLAGFPVLVLDEPTANVDRGRAERMLDELLTASAAAGRSVLLISHAPVAHPLVDRTLRLV